MKKSEESGEVRLTLRSRVQDVGHSLLVGDLLQNTERRACSSGRGCSWSLMCHACLLPNALMPPHTVKVLQVCLGPEKTQGEKDHHWGLLEECSRPVNTVPWRPHQKHGQEHFSGSAIHILRDLHTAIYKA